MNLAALQESWSNVKKVLEIRGNEEEMDLMTSLYKKFPVGPADERHLAPIDNSVLLRHYEEFGGEMRFINLDLLAVL